MSQCTFAGNPDMYGVGIRTGFYLLWFAVLLASWLVPRETHAARNLLLLYMLGIFLALIIQVSNYPNNSSTSAGTGGSLRAAEIYIVILLATGLYYALIPLYTWRLATGYSPYWDPSRWPRVTSGRVWSIANILMLLALTIFQLWFWFTGLGQFEPDAADKVCTEYGFFFSQARLRNELFIAVNVIAVFVLLLGCVVEVAFAVGLFRYPRWLRKKIKKAMKRGIRDERRIGLELLQGFFRMATASLLIVAVELTIQWNNITNVSDASTAAQLIPLIVPAGLIVRVLWIALITGDVSDEESVTISETESVVVEVRTAG